MQIESYLAAWFNHRVRIVGITTMYGCFSHHAHMHAYVHKYATTQTLFASIPPSLSAHVPYTSVPTHCLLYHLALHYLALHYPLTPYPSSHLPALSFPPFYTSPSQGQSHHIADGGVAIFAVIEQCHAEACLR